MAKILIPLILVSGLAIYLLINAGGEISMGGETHEVSGTTTTEQSQRK